MRALIALFFALALAAIMRADERAVVRIISHGATATVVASREGESWLLGCAHAYRGPDRFKRHVIDLPAIQGGEGGPSGAELVAIDNKLDLSLVRLRVGPLPAIPVAPPGHPIPQKFLSTGYDKMTFPAVRAWATLKRDNGNEYRTHEPPVPGRSGGPLIDITDPARARVVGVCSAFDMPYYPRSRQPGDGVYISHRAILQFLSANRWTLGGSTSQRGAPRLAIPPPGRGQPDCLT